MKNKSISSVLVLVLLSSLTLFGCDGAGPGAEGAASQPLSAPGGDQCALISNAAYQDLRAILVDGLANGEADIVASAGGGYASGATGLRDSFALALAILDEQIAFMQDGIGDSDPDTTNFVEGSLTDGVMAGVLEQLQQAIHWGAVSEIYNHGGTARDAVEQALLASERAAALQAHGVRCYMDSYSAR